MMAGDKVTVREPVTMTAGVAAPGDVLTLEVFDAEKVQRFPKGHPSRLARVTGAAGWCDVDPDLLEPLEGEEGAKEPERDARAAELGERPAFMGAPGGPLAPHMHPEIETPIEELSKLCASMAERIVKLETRGPPPDPLDRFVTRRELQKAMEQLIADLSGAGELLRVAGLDAEKRADEIEATADKIAAELTAPTAEERAEDL